MYWAFYDDLKLKKLLWSPWFIHTYFRVVRVESADFATIALLILM